MFKSRYTQYLYFSLAAFLFVFSLLPFVSKMAYLGVQAQMSGRHIIPMVVFIFPLLLLQVITLIFLGVASRVGFDKFIKQEKTITVLNYLIAIMLGCFVCLLFLLSAPLRPGFAWIRLLDYSHSVSGLLIVLTETFWFVIFAGLPMLLLCSLIKNLKLAHIAIASFIATLPLFSSLVRDGFDLQSWTYQLHLAIYLMSLILLLITYNLSKMIQSNYVNQQLLIGLE